MIKVFPLEQLDEITTLEVKHKKETIAGFHEIISSNDKVSEQEANNWFNKGISSKEFQYDFIIKNNQCEIVIYLVDWGYTDLIKESGKTTEQACQKAIKKFYKNYKEFWIEKSIKLFGIHLFWTKTTISYFRTKEYAIKYLEDALGKKLEEVIYFK